jgi:hypothetical protein
MGEYPLLEDGTLYARVRSKGEKKILSGFYAQVTGIWINTRTSDMVRVSIREWQDGDPPSTYWGWLPTGETRIRLIQPTRLQFNMQFPYGVDAEVKAGKGRDLVLHVEVLDEYPATAPERSE